VSVAVHNLYASDISTAHSRASFFFSFFSRRSFWVWSKECVCAWFAVLALWGCGDCGLDGWFVT